MVGRPDEPMSQYLDDTSAAVIIENYDQLVAYFESAYKPRTQWRIGTEYEKVAVRAKEGPALPFTGGIEEILRRLAGRYPWRPLREDGRIVALQGERASITLEPGGQLELSGEQCESVHCAKHEFDEHVRQIVTAADGLDVAFLGLGMQPISTLDEIEWVPKKRYRIMAPYMLKVGKLGQRMMKQTATVQVNIDYSDERDAMRKMRIGMGLSPLLTAMFANSPLSDGDLNGFMSYRAHIWTDTDPDRCGILPFVFRDDCGFADYVEYALDVPMYFIVRDGQWTDMTAYTFRHFWKEGMGRERATLADWNAHLTTLFPEFRLKRYIEVRSVDSQPPELMLAVPAIVKGVFYDDDCLEGAWDLVKQWKLEERAGLQNAVNRQALRARVRGIQVKELARELQNIAAVGLERQNVLDERGQNEACYLERIVELTKRGLCPADLVIEKWIGSWQQDPARLVEASSYRIAA
jgi:glutamate--cysteine ligase